ncbi:hypothetical protein PR048_031782 [Dryococelus australis]|uniref:Uncharacterized protein n=1 Tax=Dryococelus australis TaxID=614101 RepID=A0ABQ9G957_9NEOP|nr:hypothetical protein PR048_031782 [Dryococelus australis]
MFVPTLIHSSMYHSRQVSTYNLCLHLAHTNDSCMCMWHEGLPPAFSKLLQLELMEGKKLVIRRDNCVAPNKSRSVELKYLVSGHSYMDRDRNFRGLRKETQSFRNYGAPETRRHRVICPS